jgi:hypothetical protein
MGRAQQHISNSVPESVTAEIEASLATWQQPLLTEQFDAPIQLTKANDKGAYTLYAVGRGPYGLVVQLTEGGRLYQPQSLRSLLTHQPYWEDVIDDSVITSLSK